MSAPFSNMTVASPCAMRWEAMAGDDRVRSCSRCQQQVFFLSGMQRDEAERLIREKAGRLCVRYFQTTDGGIMTKDCPEGLQHKRQRTAALAAGLILSLLFGLFAWTWWHSDHAPVDLQSRLRAVEPFRTIWEWLNPAPPEPPALMGKICPR